MVVLDNIDTYCERHGISRKRFERDCGLGNGTISKWQNSGQNPSVRTLMKIELKTGIAVTTWLKEGAFNGRKNKRKDG